VVYLERKKSENTDAGSKRRCPSSRSMDRTQHQGVIPVPTVIVTAF
jgi:hypothetical protein